MHLVNRSCRYLPFQLLPLIDVVRKKAKFSELATLVVDDRWDGQLTGGYSIKRLTEDDVKEFRLEGIQFPTKAAPSLIKLNVSHGGQYPRTSKHVDEVGPVTFNNWAEEVLFVLAHEQAHIDQFWTTPLPEHEAEVDAERKALKVLQEHRANQADGPCGSGGNLRKRGRTSRSQPQWPRLCASTSS